MGWIAEFLGLSVTLAMGAVFTLLLWLWGHKAGNRLKTMLENGDIAKEKKSKTLVEE
jgi:hypothetical protein